MLYRILRSINAGFALAVFWVCLAAFLLALPLMFIFPPGTLLLLFLGLFGLGLSVIGYRVLQFSLHILARRRLARGSCPACGKGRESPVDAGQPWQCSACGTTYDPTGQEVTT